MRRAHVLIVEDEPIVALKRIGRVPRSLRLSKPFYAHELAAVEEAMKSSR